MRLLFILLIFAACSSDYTPPAAPFAPDMPPAAPGERYIAFYAESDGAQVAAECAVGGPAMDIRFTTPATIFIPFENRQAQTTVIECRYNGQRLSTQTPPSRQTSSITADFSNSRSEFWFKRGNGGVLYYTRGDVVVRVSGAP